MFDLIKLNNQYLIINIGDNVSIIKINMYVGQNIKIFIIRV